MSKITWKNGEGGPRYKMCGSTRIMFRVKDIENQKGEFHYVTTSSQRNIGCTGPQCGEINPMIVTLSIEENQPRHPSRKPKCNKIDILEGRTANLRINSKD